MQLVIDNYSNPLSTEPMYFNACFQRAGLQSMLWDQSKLNAFDMFDSYKPDVFITSMKTMSMDAIKYLASNGSNIDVLVNITGATQEEVDALGKILQKNNIKCPFFFKNEIAQSHPVVAAPARMKIESIYYGADLFLKSNTEVPGPKLQAGIIGIGGEFGETLLKNACEHFETYHKLIVGPKSALYDLAVSVVDLVALYPKYENIVVLGQKTTSICNQILLDASVRSSGNVTVHCMEHSPEGFFEGIISGAPKKLTCFHSSSRLLSKLGLKDESISLIKEADSVL